MVSATWGKSRRILRICSASMRPVHRSWGTDAAPLSSVCPAFRALRLPQPLRRLAGSLCCAVQALAYSSARATRFSWNRLETRPAALVHGTAELFLAVRFFAGLVAATYVLVSRKRIARLGNLSSPFSRSIFLRRSRGLQGYLWRTLFYLSKTTIPRTLLSPLTKNSSISSPKGLAEIIPADALKEHSEVDDRLKPMRIKSRL